ncbi:hypothetical protein AAFF_G00149250 [Aldrovandia affinis]|uniref:Uncharacterized protein n=1 Tax=Aldrovandia affinis TaxID=143900 RepID=A0AAD7RPH0_9TELE|nr:hypothetical protein AAFF_G00149250 [Aldrovandia affinis]
MVDVLPAGSSAIGVFDGSGGYHAAHGEFRHSAAQQTKHHQSLLTHRCNPLLHDLELKVWQPLICCMGPGYICRRADRRSLV